MTSLSRSGYGIPKNQLTEQQVAMIYEDLMSGDDVGRVRIFVDQYII
eukprot:gene12119-15225_t